MTTSGSEHDMDKLEISAEAGDLMDGDARELEELALMLRRGKAVIFSDYRDKQEGKETCGAQVQRALAAAKQASRSRRLRFPALALGSFVAAAAAALVIWLGVVPRNSELPGVTVVSFVTAESDIAPPLMRGGEAENVEGWSRAAREGAAAVRGADQVRVADPGHFTGPSGAFLRGVKTSTLVTLEEAEKGGEKCLAVRLYSARTGKMAAERFIFPSEEEDVGAAIEKAVKDIMRQDKP